MGMVGGGSDAFIGAIHRHAAFMDGQIELVCGCFSKDPEISLESGRSYYLPDNRIYGTFNEMFEKESKLTQHDRMDFVSIVTPNFIHFEPALKALEGGFHVVIDKPITFTLDEALQLQKKVQETGLILAVTYTYSGYPAIKEARERISKGELGKIRKIIVEYNQGWLSEKVEDVGNTQAAWRTDPKYSGKAGTMGDIGTHAFHLAEYVSGLKAIEICADLNTIVPGRRLDDDGVVLLHFDNDAHGILIASQIATGEENALKLRIYGDKGGLEWSQMEPNTLVVKWPKRAAEIVRAGQVYMSSSAKHNTRTPGGHPEGYIEAFANIYRNFSLTVRAKINGTEIKTELFDFPGVEDGIRGMQFIEAVVEAGNNQSKKWFKFIE